MTVKLTHRQALVFLSDGYMTAAEYLKLCHERGWRPEQKTARPFPQRRCPPSPIAIDGLDYGDQTWRSD